MPARLSIEERVRLSRCRFVAFLVVPAALALIAYSLMLATDAFNLDRIGQVEPQIFLGNWGLAPLAAAATVFMLHPVPAGRWWKSLLAAVVAIPNYYLSFAFIAVTGHALGLRL